MLFLDNRYLSLALPQNRNFELPAGPSARPYPMRPWNP